MKVTKNRYEEMTNPKCVKCKKPLDNNSWICNSCNERGELINAKFNFLKSGDIEMAQALHELLY